MIEGLGRDAKIVLYQGGIGKERDLRPVARAVSELGSPWKLVIQGILMGNDEYTKDFLANYEYTLVPPVPAQESASILQLRIRLKSNTVWRRLTLPIRDMRHVLRSSMKPVI